MPKYTHPTVRNGQITHGDAEYPIVDGVVECPTHVAEAVYGLVRQDDLVEGTAGAAPTGITSLNADKAKALIAEADSVDAVKALEAEESSRAEPRVSVLRAIGKRLEELLGAGQTTE